MINGGGELVSFGASIVRARSDSWREFEWGGSGCRRSITPEIGSSAGLPKPLFLADLKLGPLLRGQIAAFKAISRYLRLFAIWR